MIQNRKKTVAIDYFYRFVIINFNIAKMNRAVELAMECLWTNLFIRLMDT